MRIGLGSFCQASFFASTEYGNGKNVDLDDPNLWEKAVGIDVPHESIGEDEMEVIFENRIRK